MGLGRAAAFLRGGWPGDDLFRQEIINGLKGNWREQRQNFEEYQNSLGNRLTVEQLRSEVWRQRQEEDADAYTPIHGRVNFGEDRFGTGLSNASNRNRIVESQVKQIEIGHKIAEYALYLGMMVPLGGLGRAGEVAIGGLPIPARTVSQKQLITFVIEQITSEGTANIAQGAKLSEYYRQLEKYGQGGVKLLENGRYRFYGEITPATKAGQTAGRRVVREWFPVSHNKRTWMESIDHQGNVRVARPETGGEKIHYRFDANGGFVEKF